jgi:hypothetical protein
MFKNNFFHYRWVETASISPFQKMYTLGRSNSTALSHGGICIGVFLMKEGRVLIDEEDSYGSDQIVWSISRCSSKDNYWREKARWITQGKAFEKSEVLISNNYDYDTVKKIANHLAEVVNIAFHQKRNGFFEQIKSTFSIDSWVENNFQSKNVTINVQPLNGSAGIKL